MAIDLRTALPGIMVDGLDGITTIFNSNEFQSQFSEWKNQFEAFLSGDASPTVFTQVFSVHSNELHKSLKQSLYLFLKIAKKDEEFFVNLSGGFPLDVIHKLGNIALKSEQYLRYAMVAVCCAVVILPNLWKNDVRGLLDLLQCIPNYLQKFQVELTDKQVRLLDACLEYARQILERLLLNENNMRVLVNNIIKLVERHSIDIGFDLVQDGVQSSILSTHLPPMIQSILLSPNIKQGILPAVKRFCDSFTNNPNAGAIDMSPIALITQFIRNMNDNMWADLQQVQSQMGEMQNTIQQMSAEQKEDVVGQAMQFMGLQGEDRAKIENYTMSMMNDPNALAQMMKTFGQNQ